MTPTQVRDTCTLFARLYPRLTEKWTSEEWDAMREQIGRIDGLDSEQIRVVLTNYRGENDRPSIKTLVSALRSARQFKPAGGLKERRNLRVDKYRRDMMERGWGHNLSDEQVISHVCRWMAGKYGIHSAIEHLIECARDFTDEPSAFALARDTFGVDGADQVDGILRRREECRARGDAQRAARRAQMDKEVAGA